MEVPQIFSFVIVTIVLTTVETDARPVSAILQAGGGGGGGGAVVCLAIIVIVIVALVVSSNNKQKAISAAMNAYQRSLVRLKSDPTNANLKQKTLELGRVYSDLTRNRKGVTVYDEMALMNDIGAACAAANVAPTAFRSAAPPARTIENRLSELSDLLAKGLIDEPEYAARRQRILDEI